ncbi:ferrochelatase [Micromonospora sp. C28SCA-DRY-2]|uniref:ferrochelatase n=1 Tax=Micromonospora sp. C28SCA-DRY-2 TaxID=3059522 RepID=UPI0034A0A0FC
MAYDAGGCWRPFGGPERPEDVMPFPQNVTRRGVPPERLAEVAEHYQHFGGVSPINQQSRTCSPRDPGRLRRPRPRPPVYRGNRNWHPMLATPSRRDARRRGDPGARLVTSAPGGYSSCRQYQGRHRRPRRGRPDAPLIDKLRQFNHPGFVEPHVDARRAALAQRPAGAGRHPAGLHRPLRADLDAPPTQVRTAAGTRRSCTRWPGGARGGRLDPPWDLVWQSRPARRRCRLEPDVNDHLAALAAAGDTTARWSAADRLSPTTWRVVWTWTPRRAKRPSSTGPDFEVPPAPPASIPVRDDGARTGPGAGSSRTGSPGAAASATPSRDVDTARRCAACPPRRPS